VSRLDAETYAQVKAAGFKWAPKQELFVAPAWTPDREDLLIELCGEIDDEDTSLVERQEQRAERFEEYSDKREREADSARAAVDAIADMIPLGQPILVGHHSERRARRDAEKIQNGMRRAVRLWETSKYWTDRAAGAIAHAKYKERPDVRARRIKTIEADRRKTERALQENADCLKLWESCKDLTQARAIAGYSRAGWLPVVKHPTLDQFLHPSDVLPFDDRGDYAKEHYPTWTLEQVKERARAVYSNRARADRWLAHYDNRLAYERAMLAESGGLAADRFDLQPGGQVLVRGEWVTILRVNKTGGQVCSVTTNARYVRVRSVEEIKDYRPPTEDAAAKVKKITTLAPICNYPGPNFVEITQEQWDKKHKDYKSTRTIEPTDTHARHRVRYGFFGTGGVNSRYALVFITDAKRKDPPAPVAEPAPPRVAELPREELPRAPRPVAEPDEKGAAFEAIRDTLRAGVKVVIAPQLFPTPADLARQVYDMADIQPEQEILEPSAGTGALVAAFRQIPTIGRLVMVEINTQLAAGLRDRFPNADTRCADFLACNGDLGTFDRVVMNPPFERGADIEHIEHARGMLKPGGRLVAICANGPRQREKLQPIATEWHDLPAGSFAEQGTNVNAASVVIDAPEAEQPTCRYVAPSELVSDGERIAPVSGARCRECGRAAWRDAEAPLALAWTVEHGAAYCRECRPVD
jgi:tRNA A58 N-methylase Trm61